jgi:hypothetical protein
MHIHGIFTLFLLSKESLRLFFKEKINDSIIMFTLRKCIFRFYCIHSLNISISWTHFEHVYVCKALMTCMIHSYVYFSFECFHFLYTVIVKQTNQNKNKNEYVDLLVNTIKLSNPSNKKTTKTIQLSIYYPLSNKLSVSSLIWAHVLFMISSLFD